MKCSEPVCIDGKALPCGRCLCCSINRRRLWTHRLMLEAKVCIATSFLTLTYRDESVPRLKDGSQSLCKKHLQDWLKRFRKRTSPMRWRFYGIGEYGDATQRPHYHVALFGQVSCEYGRSRYSKVQKNCCEFCDTVRDTWGHGLIDCGELNAQSAAYICGYVLKKMTKVDDVRLQGREPEFCRMSNRPGIGFDAVADVADALLSVDADEDLVDVPNVLRHGRSCYPLGRYLKGKLREQIGRCTAVPEVVKKKMEEEMRPLREAAFYASRSFAEVVAEVSAGEVARVEGRNRVFRGRKVL
ncbi:MAG: replication associated protein [Microviridae sp. ctYqV29]|nr:MAG: replication associated protein [Microviridae sp. ctYqV29]